MKVFCVTLHTIHPTLKNEQKGRTANVDTIYPVCPSYTHIDFFYSPTYTRHTGTQDQTIIAQGTLPCSSPQVKKKQPYQVYTPYFLYTRYEICRKYSQYKLNFSICAGVKSPLCNPACTNTFPFVGTQ
jgi:hypothetical protein